MPTRTGYWDPRRDPQRGLTTTEARRRLAELAARAKSRRNPQAPLTTAEARLRLRYLAAAAPRRTEHRNLVYKQCPYCGNAAAWQGGGSAGAGTPFCTKCRRNLFVRAGDGNDRIPTERLKNGADVW